MNNDDPIIYNLFEILVNDDEESLNTFLQNCTDESYGVNSLLEIKKIQSKILKYDQRTKIKMISSSSFYSYGDNIPILSVSALFGSVNCLKLLLMCDADIFLPDSTHRLPVHFACAGGSIEICDILDSSGADFTQTDKYNRTCFHYACMSGNVSLVERLWCRNFELEAEDANLMRPIHFASLCNNFLEEDEKDFKCLNDGGNDVFDFLIKKNCDINPVSKDGSTPFTLALRNSPSVLNYLIEECDVHDYIKPHKKSVKSEKKTNNDDNIMTDFVYNRNAFDDMLKNIHNLNNNNEPVDDEEKKEEVKKDNIDFIDLNNFFISDDDEEDQVLPLIDACRGRRFGIVAALLKRNNDFPYNDIEKDTNKVIKIEATSNFENKNTKISIIDVEKKDIFGWPPILYAAERGSLNIVKLLVRKGANVNATSINGFSPLLAAKNRNYPDIALFLEKNGALLHP